MAFAPQQNTPPADYDPFADAVQVPSLSFRDAPIGTTYRGVITSLPVERQSRNFETGKPDVWEDGNPQISVVLRVEIVNAAGEAEERSIWAKKPSSLYRALGAAQKAAGTRFALGGTLYVRYERQEPSKNPKLSPQKIYTAKYEPPPAAPDPWGDEKPAPAAAPATSQVPAGWPTHAAQTQPPLPGTATGSRW